MNQLIPMQNFVPRLLKWLGLSAVEGTREIAHQLSTGDLALQSAPEQIKSWPVIGPTL